MLLALSIHDPARPTTSSSLCQVNTEELALEGWNPCQIHPIPGKQGNQSQSQPLGLDVEPQLVSNTATWTDAALSPVSKRCLGGKVGDGGQMMRDSIAQTSGASSEGSTAGLNRSCTVAWV